MRRDVIRGTLSSMRFGAGAWGRLAVVPACFLVLPWQCSLPPRRDSGLLAASVSTSPEPAPPPPDAPPRDSAQDPPPAVSAAIPKQEQPEPRIPAAPPPAAPLRAVTL